MWARVVALINQTPERLMNAISFHQVRTHKYLRIAQFLLLYAAKASEREYYLVSRRMSITVRGHDYLVVSLDGSNGSRLQCKWR